MDTTTHNATGVAYGIARISFEARNATQDAQTHAKAQTERISAMGESLDIVHYVDQISGGAPLAAGVRPPISEWLARVGEYQYRLVWPRCIRIGLPEFATPAAVDYFVAKKSAVIGDFNDNFAQTALHLPQLNADLAALAALTADTDGINGTIGEEYILLFPLLRNLSMVKGADWPPTLRDYMQRISQRSGVALFWDRAI